MSKCHAQALHQMLCVFFVWGGGGRLNPEASTNNANNTICTLGYGKCRAMHRIGTQGILGKGNADAWNWDCAIVALIFFGF